MVRGEGVLSAAWGAIWMFRIAYSVAIERTLVWYVYIDVLKLLLQLLWCIVSLSCLSLQTLACLFSFILLIDRFDFLAL